MHQQCDGKPLGPSQTWRYATAMNRNTSSNLHEYLSDIGKRGAAKRRVEPGICLVCRASFTGLSRRRYCSSACRLKASRQRARLSASQPALSVKAKQPLSGSDNADIPPLVARLDALRAEVSQGRVFKDSAAVIREAREERTRDLEAALGRPSESCERARDEPET